VNMDSTNAFFVPCPSKNLFITIIKFLVYSYSLTSKGRVKMAGITVLVCKRQMYPNRLKQILLFNEK